MISKLEKLKQSRVKFTITANANDLDHAAGHAFEHLAPHVTVKGFRPGKAPRPLIVQQLGKGRLLSELVDHALPELLQEAAEKAKITIIEAPAYALEKLCELNDDGTVKADSMLHFTAEADYAPDVKVGDYKKIKITPAKIEEVTNKTIEEVLAQLADRRAQFTPVDRATKKGDRVEIDFAGKRNGIPEERLASKNHPVILGSNTMIPGFEDELIGKKAGDKHSFEINFPKDYHAKDLAGEKVVFDVVVHDVSEKKLPELNDTLAQEFGHKKLDELKKAIRQERELAFADKAKQTDEAAVLEAFLPLIETEIPNSLIERELDRQIDTLREQAQAYGLGFDHYLQHLKKTEEELRQEMRPNAQKAVAIGLGLGEVVEKEDLKKEKDPGYAAIAKLVEIASESRKKK
jgi:trigger factor